ncbi:hypothetical protein DUA64_13745 [Salmonella enterica subsp. enterica serovar Abony]|nr:hypothetical protein [Salmonella enterica subsp. enterica serovar Abony]EBY6399184.1 hypothetical protein [Salmonella enterica subsp. enterica serovar Abony]
MIAWLHHQTGIADVAGTAGNTDDGTALRLGTPITGIPSTGYADTLTGGLIQRSLKRGARVSWSAITGYHRGALILITSSGQRKSRE